MSKKEFPVADEYIQRIIHANYMTTEEYRQLYQEVLSWLRSTSKEEELYFAESGYGEMLYMCCR